MEQGYPTSQNPINNMKYNLKPICLGRSLNILSIIQINNNSDIQ